LKGLVPAELLIILRGREGEFLFSEEGEPPLQIFVAGDRVTCARLGSDPLDERALVEELKKLYRAAEVAFFYRRGVYPKDCGLYINAPVDELVHRSAEDYKGPSPAS